MMSRFIIFAWLIFAPLQNEASSFVHKNFEDHEVVFIKLGGSLITHKMMPYTERPEMIDKLAKEVAKVMKARPDLKFIIGHGSGSFGHRAAIEHHYDRELGFLNPTAGAAVAKSARELHAMVLAALLKAGVPAFSIPPSATGRLERKSLRLVEMDIRQIRQVLDIGGVPVVYGDVIPFTDGKGTGIATTETVFSFLAQHFKPSKIVLLGEVKGVYPTTEDLHNPKAATPLPELTPKTWVKIVSGIEGESGYAVTGGMRQKVTQMIEAVRQNPQVEVQIASGLTDGILEKILCPECAQKTGTLIHAEEE
jgi:isopentenyl phosphate kinase